jgi:enoyl-[acyl-carrier protein] reductase I
LTLSTYNHRHPKLYSKIIEEKFMGFLTGKRILVAGVASNRSIAYGIAQAMHREGAELAFTYQNDKLKARVEEFAADFGSKIILPCDVAHDESITNLFTELANTWDKFDGFVHAIAFAPGDQLDGDYVNAVTREGFAIAHDISSYSFVAMAKACRSMLNPNSALVTLSYLGAERAIPNYNVMGLAKASLEANVRYMANAMGPEGIRVNAISAGPIRTLAASGIKDFKKMLSHCESVTPIRRTVTIEDVGNSAAFLCSNLSSGITGEVIHVDGGFSIAAMNELELK